MAFEIKSEHLSKIAGISTPLMIGLTEWLNKICPGYEIDTPQEYSHFLAQACHESNYLQLGIKKGNPNMFIDKPSFLNNLSFQYGAPGNSGKPEV